MKSFNQFNEQSIAMIGSWTSGKGIDSISENMIEKQWKLVGEFNVGNIKYQLRILNNKIHFILGKFETRNVETKSGLEKHTRFVVHLELKATRLKTLKRDLPYKKTINVDSVEIADAGSRSRGLATLVYRYLTGELGYTIIGDEYQYFGARRLWSSLSNHLDLTVDIIDIKNRKLVVADVILHQGKYDADFDERIWSYGEDKKHLRSVLRSVNQ